MIVIINYGLGNLGSILTMLKRAGAVNTIISSDLNDIQKASKLILPGVGAFDKAMENLKQGNYVDILNEKVLKKKTPCLGICLGMQILFEKSEEGKLPGLGWMKGDVIKFKFKNNNTHLKIPHMGWNEARQRKISHIFVEMFDENRFYFVHSYHVNCAEKSDILLTTNYGYEFTSGVQKKMCP